MILHVYYREGGEELARITAPKPISWQQGDELHISPDPKLKVKRGRMYSMTNVERCRVTEVHPIVCGVALIRVVELPKSVAPQM